MTPNNPATIPAPATRTQPMTQYDKTQKLAYEKVITLKHHVVDVKESADGFLVVAIIPLADNAMDCTVVSHASDDNIVRVSTSRDMRTDAKNVSVMRGL